MSSSAAFSGDSLHKPWLETQRLLRNQLLSIRDTTDSSTLKSSLHQALTRYETYYKARAESARSDPVKFLAELSSTPLERAAHWLAGWRPTTFVHLLYTESTLHFESQLGHDILNSSGELTAEQLVAVDGVHRRAVAGEREVTREMAEAQEAVVERFPPTDTDMGRQAERMGRVIGKAEELRMKTLRELVAAVGTGNAVDLLVAVAELEIGVRRVGVRAWGDRRKREEE